MPPAHEPTEEDRITVIAWSGAGFTQAAMAYHLKIDDKTLRKHYEEELAQGKELANSMVAGKLFKLAISGDFQAMRFWLQTQAKWKTKHEVEIGLEKMTLAQLITSCADELGDDAIADSSES